MDAFETRKKKIHYFVSCEGYLPWSGTLQFYRFQMQVFYSSGFQSFMTVPLQHWHTYSKGRLWYIILLWENSMCSLGKQDKDNCQHFIDRGIKHHVCPKKAFCFLFHGNFPFYKRQGLIYKILLVKWGLYKKLVFYRKRTY